MRGSSELRQKFLQAFFGRADNILIAQPLAQQHGLSFRLQAKKWFACQPVAVENQAAVLCRQQLVQYGGKISCMTGRMIETLDYPGPALVELGEKLVTHIIAVETQIPGRGCRW